MPRNTQRQSDRLSSHLTVPGEYRLHQIVHNIDDTAASAPAPLSAQYADAEVCQMLRELDCWRCLSRGSLQVRHLDPLWRWVTVWIRGMRQGDMPQVSRQQRRQLWSLGVRGIPGWRKRYP